MCCLLEMVNIKCLKLSKTLLIGFRLTLALPNFTKLKIGPIHLDLSSIEKVHTDFMKYILHVKKSTPNVMLYGDLGNH